MKTDKGQKQMDIWFDNLPSEIEEFYDFLSVNVKKFQTFDLLSYFSYYNHLHNSEQYSDYRGDRHFFVSEVIALLCLKGPFVTKTSVPESDYLELIMEMQETVLKYCGRSDALQMINDEKKRGEDVISEIADKLSMQGKKIRNPGHPEHHLIFTQKLFEPIQEEIKLLFGFSISDSVEIRRKLPELINKKCRVGIDESLAKARTLTNEVREFRKSKVFNSDTLLTEEELQEYSKYSDKENKDGFEGYFLNELFYTFGEVYTFTMEELAEFTNLDTLAVRAFLQTFSCSFPSLKEEDMIYEPVSILKTKPIIENNGRYLVPSFPLLTWAVEDFIFEEYFSRNVKSTTSISDLRHDFILNEAYEFFKRILPSANFFPTNLKYHFEGKLCETDGLILYDRVLFIIEAKGHRLTNKSKEGNKVRLQRHLADLVKKSFEQGYRTLRYIKEGEISEFKPKVGARIQLDKKEIEEIVIVSLTLEPIGNLSMSLKATNELNYFSEGHFPWILSIYDLVVLADLIENPIMLIHYIKRRKNFLSHRLLSTYEELDLFAYFLSNGLYIENTLKEADEKNISWIEFMPETDVINDYYMYKFGHKTKFTPKPRCYISKELNDFLYQLDQSRTPHRVNMALLILEFDKKSIKELMDHIKKTKKAFARDKKLHDFSIYTYSRGGIGITFMTGTNKQELDFKLHHYCLYKMDQQNSNTWMGFGDVSTVKNVYRFQSIFFANKDRISN